MGCGTSKPHTKDHGTTSAASHRASRTRPGDERNQYDIGPGYKAVKHLGQGGTGDTWHFKDLKNGRDVAVKFIKRPLPKVLQTNILREFTIQADLGFGHEHVIKAYEAVLTPTHLCLVMEMAAGGSLTSYVADKWQKAQAQGLFLSEDEARYFFKQFLSAVKYCHSHCVAHRDLKLDNTLLDSREPPVIKICDFGFAKTWSEEANMFTQIGTPVYMSPELINSKNGKIGYDGRSVDVWASGILLLVMLLGSFPFDHTEHPDPNTSEAHLEVWLQQVSKRWSEVPHMAEAIKKLSPECKDLLNRIFVIDAKKRITIEDIERHPWYRKPLPPRYQGVLDSLAARQKEIEAFHERNHKSEAKVAARNKSLEDLVQEATTRPLAGGTDEIKRIDLNEAAVLENGAAAPPAAPVAAA
ncbi:Serine threonine- kinase SAPK9 [Chlorella sorokiniana]|jgi:serine/threonine-protein kinase SRK2|uniref:Serine threonine-kinase SAPK9 n=1 Tax=Chlorella sorokiniana TaxID=3076 RepID=A0A2P6TUD9_CHLSO|nr:Serine threonine- kinase SAPK9 [Chlorella sorokiniana]|eukprot:PRW57692.1 Serine threonine- kinase SAPK9 [Chlorella sorokiniana]